VARQVWVIALTSPPGPPDGQATGSAAERTKGEETTGRRFGRLRPKSKKHHLPNSSPTAPPVPPEGGGMSAAPDDSHPTRHIGPR
jgi:hypothetical protein